MRKRSFFSLPDFKGLRLRYDGPEILDVEKLPRHRLKKIYQQLSFINRLLGIDRFQVRFFKELLIKNQNLRVAEIGPGGGEKILKLKEVAKKFDRKVQFEVFDISPEVLKLCQDKLGCENIKYRACDFTSTREKYDLIVLTNVLHHLGPREKRSLLRSCIQRASFVVVTDLKRSGMSLILWWFLTRCILFFYDPITRDDGETSILKGFSKTEAKEFAQEMPAEYQVYSRGALIHFIFLNLQQ